MQVTIPVKWVVVAAIVVVPAVVVWLLVDWLVVTDSERIRAVLDRTAAQAEAGDVDRLVDENLDADFRLAGLDRERFRAWLKKALARYDVKGIRSYQTQDKVTGDTASATVRTVVQTGSIAGDQRVDWDVEMVKRPDDDWRILSVKGYVWTGGDRVEWTSRIVQYAD